MTRIRRSPYAFFYLEDALPFDSMALLRGERPRPEPEAHIVALSILTGQHHQLAQAELNLIIAVPASDWIDAGHLDKTTIESLLEKGLLLSDTENGDLAALRQRDEAMSATAWNLYGALYHYMTQWSGVDTDVHLDPAALSQRLRSAWQIHVAMHGDAPGPFAEVSSERIVSLPGVERDGALYQTLAARRTTRAFEADCSMTLEQLDTVLRYVFGCHGYARSPTGTLCIKRTSASAGGMHPTEVYPIISDVAGIAPGIYHYSVRHHSLALLRELDSTDSRRLATSFMCGQDYLAAAQASFILTARFYRNFWKYRVHPKAYAALLMDAAHLTQTLYLVSGDLGLGAFVTLAINSRDIEEDLGFDGVSEGVIAMAGCGVRSGELSPLELEFVRDPPD